MGYAKPLAEQLSKKFFLSYFLETLGWIYIGEEVDKSLEKSRVQLE